MVVDWQQAFLELQEKYEDEHRLCVHLELLVEKKSAYIRDLQRDLEDARHIETVERMCEGCGMTFDQPKSERKRKYCSNACKQAEYRWRKESKRQALRFKSNTW